jgi:hypothetical protein
MRTFIKPILSLCLICCLLFVIQKTLSKLSPSSIMQTNSYDAAHLTTCSFIPWNLSNTKTPHKKSHSTTNYPFCSLYQTWDWETEYMPDAIVTWNGWIYENSYGIQQGNQPNLQNQTYWQIHYPFECIQ